MSPEPQRPISLAKARHFANLLGISILVLGLTCAAWVWFSQAGQNEKEDLVSLGLALAPEDSAKYEHQVEIYSGRLGVFVDKWTRQAEELTHGKPLAETLAILSILGASGCFLAGAMLKRIASP